MTLDSCSVTPVGWVESSLVNRADAPKQASEGAPTAWVVFEPSVAKALADVAVGDRLVLLTWLHKSERDVLAVHPRSDPANPLTGVFSTRSPDRPNPIGMHPVEVVEVDGLRLRVDQLEAIDGTPIIDVKPELRDCHRPDRAWPD